MILEDITPEKIAEAINKVFRSSEQYAALCDGVDKMEKEMTWEKESEKLVRIYNEVARR